MDVYTLLYLKWITSRDLLYSTGNSVQCYGAWMGREFGGTWIHVYVWLTPPAVPLKLSQSCWSAIAVVHSPGRMRLFVTPWIAACQASLSLTIFRSLPKFKFIALEMLSSHLILWCPLLLLPSVFPSIRDFSNESSVCIRWAKYWKFSFSISPSSEYSGLVSLKINWLDLVAAQGTLKSLPIIGYTPIQNKKFNKNKK